ncbi:hypothetical protein DHX103_06845 [Planococcus sp. X10-3]|uniref:hypothetical protein n=1 Tax=Planococcus sp. X10-3 TaxID=3061240 RepID=UPI003BB1EA3A
MDLNTLEVKILAAMGTGAQLNIFEVEKMFDEAMNSIAGDVPTKNQCLEHQLKKLHSKLLLPNKDALPIVKEIYDFTIMHEFFEEQMEWQEVSDAADDFQYGNNFYGYTAETIDEMILKNARKLWDCRTSGITFKEFIGQKVLGIDTENNFIVQFEKGAIIIECPWRIRDLNGVLVGETDIQSHQSEWGAVVDLLVGKTIQDVQLYENCPFLIVQCDGIFLDIFHASSVFDGWTLTDEAGTYYFSMHGGSHA